MWCQIDRNYKDTGGSYQIYQRGIHRQILPGDSSDALLGGQPNFRHTQRREIRYK